MIIQREASPEIGETFFKMIQEYEQNEPVTKDPSQESIELAAEHPKRPHVVHEHVDKDRRPHCLHHEEVRDGQSDDDHVGGRAEGLGSEVKESCIQGAAKLDCNAQKVENSWFAIP